MKGRFVATLVAALLLGFVTQVPRADAAFAAMLDSMELGNPQSSAPVRVGFDLSTIKRLLDARATRDTSTVLAMIKAKEIASQPYGLAVTVYGVGPGWREVEILSGSLRGKTVYVDEKDLHYAGKPLPPPVIVAAGPPPIRSTDRVKPPLPGESAAPRRKVSHWRPAPPPMMMDDFAGGWGGLGWGTGAIPQRPGYSVHVNGYNRGDGTYVREHWRRPPGMAY